MRSQVDKMQFGCHLHHKSNAKITHGLEEMQKKLNRADSSSLPIVVDLNCKTKCLRVVVRWAVEKWRVGERL